MSEKANLLMELMGRINLPRCVGKTYEMSKVCRDNDWTYIVENQSQKRELESRFKGLKCLVLNSVEKLKGTREVFLVDHFALGNLVYSALKEKGQQLSEAQECIRVLEKALEMEAISVLREREKLKEFVKGFNYKLPSNEDVESMVKAYIEDGIEQAKKELGGELDAAYETGYKQACSDHQILTGEEAAEFIRKAKEKEVGI